MYATGVMECFSLDFKSLSVLFRWLRFIELGPSANAALQVTESSINEKELELADLTIASTNFCFKKTKPSVKTLEKTTPENFPQLNMLRTNP